jgi:hypothetical protein
MREGLHVSVSQVKCYLRCPRQYQLRYVLGAEPEFMPANLVLGSAVHEGLAAYYRSVMTTSESPEFDVCMAAFHATLVGFRKKQVADQGRRQDRGAGRGALEGLLREHYQDPPNVVGVEVPFTIDLPDPTTGEILEEALGRCPGPGGARRSKKHVVVEHKTAAKKWSKIKSSTKSSSAPTSWWRGSWVWAR